MAVPPPASPARPAHPFRRRRLVAGALALVAVAVVVSAAWVGADRLSTGRAAGARPPPTAPIARVAAPTTTTTSVPGVPGTDAVTEQTVTFTDPTRQTPARGSVPAQSGRVLTTVIRRPVGVTGPLPLVVFAHGWDSDPAKYATLLDAWASAGYLVAAPTLPDSADTLPGTPVSDPVDQALDLSFVVTAMLGGAYGPVDPARIAVAGHSDGGTDVALLALDPSVADHRIRAYLSLSGQIPTWLPGPFDAVTPGSLLSAVGTDDEYGLYPQSFDVYQSATMAKVFVSAAGGDHLDTFVGATPAAVAMRAETVRFLDAALAPGTPTSAGLAAALTPTGDPTLSVDVAPPPGT